MKQKKKTPEQQAETLCKDILREICVWNNLNEYGGQDPFWTDGDNMFLTRNHIIHDKNQIKEICTENGLEFPEEYYLPTPPEVPSNYMANLNQKDRVARLTHGGRTLSLKKVKYDQNQMSMF